MPAQGKRNSDTPEVGEVYFEFIHIGNAVKLSAVDAATGVEVSVMGPKVGSPENLKRVALRKLQAKLSKSS